VDLFGEEEAEDEGDAEREQRLDQARAQLDQMIHQRRFAGLDILGAHDALASRESSSASAAAGPVGLVAGCGWLSGVSASGSDAAACVSASASGLAAAGASRFDAVGASALAAGLSMSSILSAALTSFCSEVMTLPLVKPVAASLTS